MVLLSFIFIFLQVLPVNAAGNSGDFSNDGVNTLYENGTTEEAIIDGVTYIYYCYLDGEGNRNMTITNDFDSSVDYLKYDLANGTTYINGEVVAERVPSEVDRNGISLLDNNWIYWGSVDHTITWPEGTSVAAVAGAIAIGVGFIGPEAVIAAIGYGVLSIIAAGSPGGRVNATIYKFNSSVINQYKVIWMFKDPQGAWHGPYTSIA